MGKAEYIAAIQKYFADPNPDAVKPVAADHGYNAVTGEDIITLGLPDEVDLGDNPYIEGGAVTTEVEVVIPTEFELKDTVTTVVIPKADVTDYIDGRENTPFSTGETDWSKFDFQRISQRVLDTSKPKGVEEQGDAKLDNQLEVVLRELLALQAKHRATLALMSGNDAKITAEHRALVDNMLVQIAGLQEQLDQANAGNGGDIAKMAAEIHRLRAALAAVPVNNGDGTQLNSELLAQLAASQSVGALYQQQIADILALAGGGSVGSDSTVSPALQEWLLSLYASSTTTLPGELSGDVTGDWKLGAWDLGGLKNFINTSIPGFTWDDASGTSSNLGKLAQIVGIGGMLALGLTGGAAGGAFAGLGSFLGLSALGASDLFGGSTGGTHTQGRLNVSAPGTSSEGEGDCENIIKAHVAKYGPTKWDLLDAKCLALAKKLFPDSFGTT